MKCGSWVFVLISATHEATLDLLTRYPDLIGLYVAGGEMEEAISVLENL
ncbi:hypothetical protein [Thiothrix eikelboomii]